LRAGSDAACGVPVPSAPAGAESREQRNEEADRMKSARERAEERRQEKLLAMQQEIDAGRLTVRKMTAKERAAHPPRPRPAPGQGRRRAYS
jgi:hypothetical protein